VQLWANIIASVNSVGNKRLLDEDGKLRRSRWYFDMGDDDSSEED